MSCLDLHLSLMLANVHHPFERLCGHRTPWQNLDEGGTEIAAISNMAVQRPVVGGAGVQSIADRPVTANASVLGDEGT